MSTPKYDILCAWCEKEGIKTIVGQSNTPHSHGICKKHQKEMFKLVEKMEEEENKC